MPRFSLRGQALVSPGCWLLPAQSGRWLTFSPGKLAQSRSFVADWWHRRNQSAAEVWLAGFWRAAASSRSVGKMCGQGIHRAFVQAGQC